MVYIVGMKYSLVPLFFVLLHGTLCSCLVSQIHIAQGKTPKIMTISWTSTTAGASTVKYGVSAENIDQSAEGYSTSYTFKSPPLSNYSTLNVSYTSGIIHHTQLEDLATSTTYYYECGDFTTGDTSGLLSFTTLPKVSIAYNI
jgi:hypothetical protein